MNAYEKPSFSGMAYEIQYVSGSIYSITTWHQGQGQTSWSGTSTSTSKKIEGYIKSPETAQQVEGTL